ncbi:hypothetical protein Bbelb_315030 [Branchiostoma belcheri]|nr:hypothetical protein Bbelb_315030 [Branchiostoma belcheri]
MTVGKAASNIFCPPESEGICRPSPGAGVIGHALPNDLPSQEKPDPALTPSHLTSDKRPPDRQGCEHTSQLLRGAKLKNRLTATFWNIQVKFKGFLPCVNVRKCRKTIQMCRKLVCEER